jgi:hypothetical protein
MRYRIIPGSVLAALLLSADPARAQTGRIFAGAGVIADNDQTNSALTESTVASWSIVVGMDISPYLGIRILLDAPRETSRFAEGIYTRAPATLPVHEQLTSTRRSMTYGLLGDVHRQFAQRLRLAGTFGVVTVTHDSALTVVRHELRADGNRVRLSDLRDKADHDWSGLVFGVETGVLFGRRVEIVPEVRLIYFGLSDSPSPYIVRSGLGLRWRF